MKKSQNVLLFFIIGLSLGLVCNSSIVLSEEELTITPESTNNPENLETADEDIGEETNTQTEEDEEREESPSLPTVSDLDSKEVDDAKKILNEGTKAAKNSFLSSIGDVDESVILPLPDVLQKPTIFLFRISDQDSISLELFIILMALFVAFFIIVFGATEVFTDNSLLRLLITLSVACITSLTGIMYKMVMVITNIFVDRLSNSILSQTALVVIIVVALVLVILFAKLIKKMVLRFKYESQDEEAEQSGKKFGGAKKVSNRMFRNAGKP